MVKAVRQAILDMERHLKAAQSRRPGWAVGLWGEAGVGKSFAVQVLLGQSPIGSLSLHAGVSEEALLGALPRPAKLPLWAEHLVDRLKQGQAVNSSSRLEVTLAWLSALAPFVLHLEDLHEVGAERQEFIQQLGGAVLRTRGLGLIVTSRAEPPKPFKGYRLEALSRPESDALLEFQAGGALPPEGLGYVFARAEGNALFTAEFWRYLLRQGCFWSDGQHWHWRSPPARFVPVSLEALIAQLAQGVLPQVRAVLEARSIFPNSLNVTPVLWARVAEVDQAALDPALTLLMHKGLLHAGGFVHPLIREVVQREIPPEAKRGYARRAMVALDHQPEAAAEFIELAQPQATAALDLTLRAAEAAQAKGNHPAQARWLSAAVGWSSGSEQIERAFKAAQALRDLHPAQAIQMAEVAASASPQNPEAVFLLVELLALEGYIQQAEQRLGQLPPSEETALRWWEIQVWIASQHNLWPKTIELWNSQPQFQVRASVRIRRLVGSSLAYLHRLDEAQQVADSLANLAGLSIPDTVAVLNLCAQIQRYRGHHQTVLEIEQRYLPLARQAGLTKTTLLGLLNHASTCGALGLRQETRQSLEEARALAAQVGDTLIYSIVQLRLGGELTDEGHYEAAEALCLEAQDLLYRHQQIQWQTECHLKQARLYLNWQPPHGVLLALKHASAALGRARANQDANFLILALAYASRAESLAHNPQAALRLAEEALGLCGSQPDHPKTSDAWFAYGLALEADGRPEEAKTALRTAYTRQPERKLAERMGLELDRLEGDLSRARQRYGWFCSVGLFGPAKLARRYFPQLENQAEVKLEAPDRPCLRVLGTPTLWRSGEPIAYRGKKRLELLCYLLEARIAGRSEVGVLDLADAFYPDVSEDEAKRTLKQQMYLIRTSLGQDCIHSTPSGYALGHIGSDAEDFLKTGDPGLWRGPYLDTLGEGWTSGVREALVQALGLRADKLLPSDPALALRLAHILVQMEPYDLSFMRLALAASHQAQPGKPTLRLYQEARARFQDVGEALPEALEDFLQTALPV